MTSLPIVATHGSCVSRVPLFSGLNPDAQETVGSYAHPTHLSKGQLLHSPGSDLAQLFVVHSGRLKVVRVTAGGFERLLRVAEPGDVIGENAFLTGQRPDTYVEALQDTSVCTFQHRELARLMAAHPEIGMQLLQTLSTRLEEAERALSHHTVGVPARLANYLLELPSHSGPRGFEVTWPLSKREVASYLGTTPESLSRALATLESLDLIVGESRRSTILLDVDGLERLTTS